MIVFVESKANEHGSGLEGWPEVILTLFLKCSIKYYTVFKHSIP